MTAVGQDPDRGGRATLSRRNLLAGVCAGAAVATANRLWAPAAAFAASADHTLVTLFLRGGLDGLSAVVPHDDARYHDLRPTIAVRGADQLPLGRGFGLHPALAPLHELRGMLAVVHATGQLHGTRSHFDAQQVIECGADGPRQLASGWLARHLAAVGATAAPLHAVAWGNTPPASLAGDPTAVSMTRLDDFGLASPGSVEQDALATLRALYGGSDLTAVRARATLAAIGRVESLRERVPATTVEYPTSTLGRALGEIARTIRAEEGLVAATVDVGGWDTHAGIGDAHNGYLARRLADLAGSLHAFAHDLGDRMRSTTVLVMSEFGRRVAENGSGGLDHGRGTAMFVLGDGVRAGVHGSWAGLDEEALDHGDVAVANDHRDLLADVLVDRMGGTDLARVLPGFRRRPLGVG